MSKYLAESDIETAAIEWLLEDKRFRYHYGPEIHRSHKKAVIEEVFTNYLKERYKHVPAKILAEVQQEFLYQAGTDIHLRNHAFHIKLSKMAEISRTFIMVQNILLVHIKTHILTCQTLFLF